MTTAFNMVRGCMTISNQVDIYMCSSIQSLSRYNFISNPNFFRTAFVINRNLHKMELTEPQLLTS
jgi:hypothetical protein